MEGRRRDTEDKPASKIHATNLGPAIVKSQSALVERGPRKFCLALMNTCWRSIVVIRLRRCCLTKRYK